MLLGSGGVDGKTTSIVTSVVELASPSLVSAAATLEAATVLGAGVAGEADPRADSITLAFAPGELEVPLARGGLLTRAAVAAGAVDGRAGTRLVRSAAGTAAAEGSCGGRLNREAAGEGDGVGATRLGRSAVADALGPCGGLLRRTPCVVPLTNGLCCVLVRPAGADGEVDVLCGSLPEDVGAVDVLGEVSLRCAAGGL